MDQRITMIPIAELRHHPKNPRKEIGDVSDLASSIKEAGIMQNLTVVQDPDYDPDPGHKKTSFWEMLEDLCEYKPTEDELALINGTLPCCSMRVSNAEIKNFLERNPEGESA